MSWSIAAKDRAVIASVNGSFCNKRKYCSSATVLSHWANFTKLLASRVPFDAEAARSWASHGPAMAGAIAIKNAVDGSHQQILMECNPRFTSATYPALIAEKLGLTAWQTKRYSTSHRTLQCLDLTSVTFDQQKKKGVILLDWGMLLLGAPLFMLIGESEEQQYFDQKLQAILA